jgi:hypothetical protein
LYTSKPFDFNILFAEALRIPEAQQVITGLLLSNLLQSEASTFNGMFLELRM